MSFDLVEFYMCNVIEREKEKDEHSVFVNSIDLK